MDGAGLPLAWLDDMPYSIMSVHDLEKAAGVINVVGIRPYMSGKLVDPELRRWGFGAYANTRYPNEVAGLHYLFRDEFDAMFATLPRT
jgi:hypothetical protein